jgi:pyrroloquinoline-quinone synthase
MRTYVHGLKERLAARDLAYVRGLHDGSLSREDFIETQIQFFFAVVFFSRPMLALAGRLPRPELRLALLDNVADEHGHGKLRLSHESTFLELLARFGVSPAAIESRALWPEVRTFNTALSGLCLLDDVPTALSALGMIEDLFSAISGRIGQGIAARGWLPLAEIVHYATHETLDEIHADSFYSPLEANYDQPRARYQIQQGLELGGHLLVDLYRHLWNNRARRWQRSVSGPHSLSEGWYPRSGVFEPLDAEA